MLAFKIPGPPILDPKNSTSWLNENRKTFLSIKDTFIGLVVFQALSIISLTTILEKTSVERILPWSYNFDFSFASSSVSNLIAFWDHPNCLVIATSFSIELRSLGVKGEGE